MLALGRNPKRAEPSQVMIIKLILNGTHGNRKVYTLINYGVRENFISQYIVVKEGFIPISTNTRAKAINSYFIIIYG